MVKAKPKYFTAALAAIAIAGIAATARASGPSALARHRVLRTGLWCYWFLDADPAPYWTAEQIVARAREYGFTGVILHSSTLTGWRGAVERVAAGIAAAGLDVAIGIGLDPDAQEAQDWTRYRAACADAIASALAWPYPVVLDWEGPWESLTTGGTDAHRDDAAWIVQRVLERRPDAVGRVADVPWWKPSVHSKAPTAEFGRLCAFDRYVQAYGAARTRDGETLAGTEGRTARMLSSAIETEYPAFCLRARVERCYEIMGCVQAYQRTAEDHRALILRERAAGRTLIYWHLLALDDAAKTALRSTRG